MTSVEDLNIANLLEYKMDKMDIAFCEYSMTLGDDYLKKLLVGSLVVINQTPENSSQTLARNDYMKSIDRDRFNTAMEYAKVEYIKMQERL